VGDYLPTYLQQANQVPNWFAGYSLSLPMGIHTFTSPPPGCTNLLWQDCVGVYFNRRVRLEFGLMVSLVLKKN
jgi:hypothetical protein